MNAAVRKIRRAQILNQLEALAEWRSELTTEIFETAIREQVSRKKRNGLDLAIGVAFLELEILSEKIK